MHIKEIIKINTFNKLHKKHIKNSINTRGNTKALYYAQIDTSILLKIKKNILQKKTNPLTI